MTLAASTIDTLRGLQELIGRANADKGFHGEGDRLRALQPHREDSATEGESALRNYYTARVALITTEAAEAIEELRNGRAVDETWYSAMHEGVTSAWVEGERPVSLPEHILGKPEGVPSELADIVIRALDLAEEAHIDLAGMIAEKLAYNASRARMHGRKF